MSAEPGKWYEINDIVNIDSPAVVVYLDRIRDNIKLALSIIKDASRLRPHVKTNKCREAVMLMMEEGILKFKCATIAEAEMLGICKAPDVLLAYQPVGPKIDRFISLIKKYPGTRFSCLIDNEASAELISAKASAENLKLTTFIDLNVGMNRTGVLPQKSAALYEKCSQLTGIHITGLHAYDGHINDTNLEERTRSCDEAFKPVNDIMDQLAANGLVQPVIVAGGSPTFPILAANTNYECSPGTIVFWDKGYADLFPDLEFKPAALVITRLISIIDENSICLDLGHKSIAPENDIQHRVYFLNAPGIRIKSQSEEHLVVELPHGHEKKLGDVLYGMPVHICPTIALHERVYVIQDHNMVNEWRIEARDRKITV
jgi:D-serine deaminase-like pyridoxal phosphate-dependent protein